jgi:cell filamentation protein
MSRYTVDWHAQRQYEKNSGERVLANNSGLLTHEMDSVELVLLEQLYRSVLRNTFQPDCSASIS